MKSARTLMSTGRLTNPLPTVFPLEASRALVSRISNTHNRAFRQSSRGYITSRSQTLTTQHPSAMSMKEKHISHKSNPTSQSPHTTPAVMPPEPTIHSSYEANTGSWQYIVADPTTLRAVVIDSVLDYDAATHTISTQTADTLLSLISDKGYTVDRILETHVHADHLTAASYLQSCIEREQGHRPAICIGKRITQVQKMFASRYGVPKEEYMGVFDQLLDDNEAFQISGLTATVMHLPGHTPDHIGYKIGENVFCGDTLFHADIGTARCDFPGGDAVSLWNSGQRLLQLPEHTKVWTGHDYTSATRDTPVPWMSVRDHKLRNKHLSQAITREEFVAQRQERDENMAEPKLLHASLQANIRAGRLPKATGQGQRFLHFPLAVENAEIDW